MPDDAPPEPGAGRPLPPRPPRAFGTHVLVDAVVGFLVIVVPGLLLHVAIGPILAASVVIGLAAAPWSHRAELRSLARREERRRADEGGGGGT